MKYFDGQYYQSTWEWKKVRKVRFYELINQVMTFDEVVNAWNDWLNWYCEVRPKMIYGGRSVAEGRKMVNYKKVA